MGRDRSAELYARALGPIPGGVNSPVRAFRGVGGEPLFFESGEGAWLTDVDGNRYIDYVGAWGPLILGHRHPAVNEALRRQLEKGTGYGASTEAEVELAELVCRLIPSIEQLRLVTSGTEATMSAIRLARGFTGRDAMVKFEGCYHGHADGLLVKAGSGALTLGAPDSPGVPEGYSSLTHVLPYNDPDALDAYFAANGGNTACVIIEPVAGNMNCVPAQAETLSRLRSLCDEYGVLLIFDEVMSGFRVALGGAQSIYGVQPDLTALGKVIGGGLPVGAFGGRREIMSRIAPEGPVYQAGTLAGNPLAVAAGLATLAAIAAPGFFDSLKQRAEKPARRPARAGPGRIRAIHHEPSWCDVRDVLQRGGAGADFRSSHGLRHRSFPQVLPRHARPWRLSGAFRFRGGFPLRRPWRARDRADPRRRRKVLRGDSALSGTLGDKVAPIDVYGLGNALVDIEYEVDEDFFPAHGVRRGVMTLVSHERQEELISALLERGDARKMMGGGLGCQFAVCRQQFWRQRVFVLQGCR